MPKYVPPFQGREAPAGGLESAEAQRNAAFAQIAANIGSFALALWQQDQSRKAELAMTDASKRLADTRAELAQNIDFDKHGEIYQTAIDEIAPEIAEQYGLTGASAKKFEQLYANYSAQQYNDVVTSAGQASFAQGIKLWEERFNLAVETSDAGEVGRLLKDGVQFGYFNEEQAALLGNQAYENMTLQNAERAARTMGLSEGADMLMEIDDKGNYANYPQIDEEARLAIVDKLRRENGYQEAVSQQSLDKQNEIQYDIGIDAYRALWDTTAGEDVQRLDWTLIDELAENGLYASEKRQLTDLLLAYEAYEDQLKEGNFAKEDDPEKLRLLWNRIHRRAADDFELIEDINYYFKQKLLTPQTFSRMIEQASDVRQNRSFRELEVKLQQQLEAGIITQGYMDEQLLRAEDLLYSGMPINYSDPHRQIDDEIFKTEMMNQVEEGLREIEGRGLSDQMLVAFLDENQKQWREGGIFQKDKGGFGWYDDRWLQSEEFIIVKVNENALAGLETLIPEQIALYQGEVIEAWKRDHNGEEPDAIDVSMGGGRIFLQDSRGAWWYLDLEKPENIYETVDGSRVERTMDFARGDEKTKVGRNAGVTEVWRRKEEYRTVYFDALTRSKNRSGPEPGMTALAGGELKTYHSGAWQAVNDIADQMVYDGQNRDDEGYAKVYIEGARVEGLWNGPDPDTGEYRLLYLPKRAN
jgi:hypothetical protein